MPSSCKQDTTTALPLPASKISTSGAGKNVARSNSKGGLTAVQMGMAAQESASQSRIIHFSTSNNIAKSPKSAIKPYKFTK